MLHANVAELGEMKNFSLVIAELMDFGGLGENIIRMVQHAQEHIMGIAGEKVVIPARLRLMASAGHYSIPDVGGEDDSFGLRVSDHLAYVAVQEWSWEGHGIHSYITSMQVHRTLESGSSRKATLHYAIKMHVLPLDFHTSNTGID